MSPVARRRAVLGATIALPILAAILILTGGSHTHTPLYTPKGLASRTIGPVPRPAPALRATVLTRPPSFTPSPAARRAARGLTPQQQAALLFLPAVPLDAASLQDALGGEPWGGVVFLPAADPAAAGDGAAAAAAGSASAILRGAGDPSPLLGILQPGGGAGALPADPPISERRQGRDPSGAVSAATATKAAALLLRLGFNLTVAPEADVDVPQGTLHTRLFSTDPGLVARLSSAATRAYVAAKLIPVPGHFPGQGSASADPDQMSATVGGTLSELATRDLVPFAALARRAPVIELSNASYAALDGVTPADLLPRTVALLRNRLGFRGVVMSGDLDAAAQVTGQDAGRTALQALAAGCDLLLISGSARERLHALEAVVRAAAREPVLADEIRESVLRVLTLEDRFGLLH